MSEEPIVIVDYDPDWPLLFADERDRLREALGEGADRIDHVGSTAVPGLAAKPIIDIQISVPTFEGIMTAARRWFASSTIHGP